MRKQRRKEREIQAIPTEYKGVQFRSRFEANTAQQFDACGWQWEYEPKSFLLPSGHYWPDFYLPQQRLWIECRGYESETTPFSEFAGLVWPHERLLVLRWSDFAAIFHPADNRQMYGIPAKIIICVCRRSFITWLYCGNKCPFCGEHPEGNADLYEGINGLDQTLLVAKSGVVGCVSIQQVLDWLIPFRRDVSQWQPLKVWFDEWQEVFAATEVCDRATVASILED